jgi:hypothetical protein
MTLSVLPPELTIECLHFLDFTRLKHSVGQRFGYWKNDNSRTPHLFFHHVKLDRSIEWINSDTIPCFAIINYLEFCHGYTKIYPSIKPKLTLNDQPQQHQPMWYHHFYESLDRLSKSKLTFRHTIENPPSHMFLGKLQLTKCQHQFSVIDPAGKWTDPTLSILLRYGKIVNLKFYRTVNVSSLRLFAPMVKKLTIVNFEGPVGNEFPVQSLVHFDTLKFTFEYGINRSIRNYFEEMVDRTIGLFCSTLTAVEGNLKSVFDCRPLRVIIKIKNSVGFILMGTLVKVAELLVSVVTDLPVCTLVIITDTVLVMSNEFCDRCHLNKSLKYIECIGIMPFIESPDFVWQQRPSGNYGLLGDIRVSHWNKSKQ